MATASEQEEGAWRVRVLPWLGLTVAVLGVSIHFLQYTGAINIAARKYQAQLEEAAREEAADRERLLSRIQAVEATLAARSTLIERFNRLEATVEHLKQQRIDDHAAMAAEQRRTYATLEDIRKLLWELKK